MHLLNMFNLQELEKLNVWKREQLEKCREKQGLSSDEDLNVGSIGGLYTYSITPTSLGTIITVTNNITEEILDLSDYDSW